MKKFKTIVWDIETLVILPEAMRVFPGLGNYPGLTLRASINSIICVGWKELGSKKTHCINAWDFPKRWKADVNDDYDVVKAAYDVLHDADAIVTHNGKRFDYKFLNTRLTFHGLPPLPKIPHIDTCSVAKQNLFVFNNRLNTLAKHFKLPTKLENGGWDLWCDVMVRKKKAMKLMEKYCKQDVVVLEHLYYKLLPYISNMPNHNLIGDGEKLKCPTCGSSHLTKHGKRRTQTTVYQRYICGDCGSTCRTDGKDQMPRSI